MLSPKGGIKTFSIFSLIFAAFSHPPMLFPSPKLVASFQTHLLLFSLTSFPSLYCCCCFFPHSSSLFHSALLIPPPIFSSSLCVEELFQLRGDVCVWVCVCFWVPDWVCVCACECVCEIGEGQERERKKERLIYVCIFVKAWARVGCFFCICLSESVCVCAMMSLCMWWRLSKGLYPPL